VGEGEQGGDAKQIFFNNNVRVFLANAPNRIAYNHIYYNVTREKKNQELPKRRTQL
jgi:hypothetical protein